ncbi:glycosyltransferase [Nocardiopsis ansamitocini]|uniref:Glycosyl transferase n=1 Tax=Nocardiopsis ansamitocini TaxID=1670832 RepID=A0A9W6UIC1_9ACTN|nr:glycosyltransferase [Nocardiopsis ansamitocini]GLU47524.1 glycosyl transferase [Nocardiopsis ansamitocini]
MKIAMVSEHANPVGAHKGEPTCGDSVHLTSVARQLAKLGHRVTVYTRHADPATAERTRMGRGVTVEHLTAGPVRKLDEAELPEHTAAFASALTTALTNDVPDVVHAFGWSSGLATMAAVRDSGHEIPTVQSFHSLSISERRAGLPGADRVRLEAALAQNADSVLVNSSEQMFELARMGVPRSTVSVVPYGVDAEHFSVDGVQQGPWHHRRTGAGQRLRVIAVTGLGRESGADSLIDMMVRVPESELLIVGGPSADDLTIDPDARRLEQRAKEAGVDDRITLTGAVDRKELPRILRSADVFVSTASYDPYGGAVLEAMACGLPVVARAVGSVTGAVLDGTTGVLLRSARPDTLGRILRTLSADATKRTAYGIAGSDRAASRFGWERIAGETERIYTKLFPMEAELPLAVGDDAN